MSGLRDSIVPTKIASRMTMSREVARRHGLIESTPEELAEDERLRVEFEARKAAHEKVLAAARVRLGAIQSDGPLRAVLDLHVEVEEYGEPTCDHCRSGEDGDRDSWPCETVRVVAVACGIVLPRWGA